MANGYILHQTKQRVVIATMESANAKTGDMVQVWILRADMHPLDAVATGADSAICGNCPHRGTSCYVNIGQAPAAVYRTFLKGGYARLTDYSVFLGRYVRLGAYGDPACIPQSVIRKITANAAGWTGYTHQWKRAEWLRGTVMASCDSNTDFEIARSNGWRTFRVSTDLKANAGEILCPASNEAGNRTQCINCRLCDGAKSEDRRKSIFIPVHGANASKFTILN